MAADARDVDAMLDGWRETGADRLDPLGFHRIAALHRRALTRDGKARRVLDSKVAALVEAYARRVADARDTAPATRGRGALGTLVDAMAERPRAASPQGAPAAAWPELPAVEDARALWSTLRTRTQVRRSLAQAPTGAGPLNSAALTHRALTLMGDRAPGYLEHFLAYVDTLSWLETLQDAGVLPGREGPQPTGAKPRSRPRARRKA